MADATLYKLLGVSKEQADEIARRVRAFFACGWFAGKYAGVSEVFNVVAREIDEIEKENKYPPPDGYA